MSKWITDRLPTFDDADDSGDVYRPRGQQFVTLAWRSTSDAKAVTNGLMRQPSSMSRFGAGTQRLPTSTRKKATA